MVLGSSWLSCQLGSILMHARLSRHVLLRMMLIRQGRWLMRWGLRRALMLWWGELLLALLRGELLHALLGGELLLPLLTGELLLALLRGELLLARLSRMSCPSRLLLCRPRLGLFDLRLLGQHGAALLG